MRWGVNKIKWIRPLHNILCVFDKNPLNFNIENINSIPVIINNKEYNQYKIFEATYYPFNTDDISFPQLGLELIKYKVSKKLSFFGRNKVEDYEKFYSKPTTVKVEELPEHPLKENIAVGDFKVSFPSENRKLKESANVNKIDILYILSS